MSVITINRNSGDGAARTAVSVRQQTADFQWVVIDGGSNDQSSQDLRAAARAGDIFISEPDHGIADAFGKGLRHANGDLVLFLNAGDVFAASDVVQRLIDVFAAQAQRWIIGTAQTVRANGTELYSRPMDTGQDPWRLVRNGCRIFHQAVVAERRLFDEFGDFRSDFKSSMDYELWLRWLSRDVHPTLVDITVCRYQVDGISGDPWKRFAEERQARAMHRRANPWYQDVRLAMIARLKSWLKPLASPTMFRIKELLGW